MFWLGSIQDDLTAASEDVRETTGCAIRDSRGCTLDDVEPNGNLRYVIEVRESGDAGIWRLM